MYLNSVETKITVDGKNCDFIYMNLDQSMSDHHVFEIAVSYRHEKQSVWELTVDDIFRETLNKTVIIKMTHRETGEANEFYGVVTDIDVLGVDGDKGTVILRGGSPTILLDRDPAMDSFVDYNLYNIVAATIEKTGIQVDLQNNPSLKLGIPYVARYKESSYAFLSRILYSYGEWFYYDGKKLIVGNPYNQKERRVTFDMELVEVRSTAGIRNLNTKYYEYDPTINNYLEEDSSTIYKSNLRMKAAKIVSDPLYPSVSKLPVGREVLGEKDMSRTVKVKQSREYNKTSVFTAKCKTCGIRVGEIATAVLPDFPDVWFLDLGSFRVLEVCHRVNREGHYENTFKGITAQTEVLPDDHIVVPQAFQEPAVVVDNNDPRKKGRVKVRYFWQPRDESTNWIRVQTQDAGSSDRIEKNRGFVFIPEIGDQVMIGFLYGDPSRPYVMGSLFHGFNTIGGGKDNSIKSIVTKSGIKIVFNDDKKSLHIEDPSGNTWDMDGNGNISVNAPETISFTAKEIDFNAAENLSAYAGINILMHANEDLELMAGDFCNIDSNTLFVRASEDVKLTSNDNKIKANKVRIDSTDENLELASTSQVEVQSTKRVRMS